MNKDAILATLIGFGVGIIITSAVLFGPNLIKRFPTIHIPNLSFKIPSLNMGKPSPKPPAKQNKPTTIQFKIDSPLDDSLSDSADILVSGSAHPGSTIIIGGPNDEQVILVPDSNTYAGKISLSEGENEISVAEFIDGKTTLNKVTVFYTPEKF
jgi:hypothetical protein